MVTKVEDLHAELDFERHSPSLRKIKGVWNAIKSAEQAARRDPTKLKAYRAVLERAIARNKQSTVAVDDDAEQLGRELSDFGEQLYQKFQVAAHVRYRMPSESYAWMKKHHPEVTSKTDDVLEAFYQGPSQESLQQAKAAVQEFVEVFSGVGNN